MATKTEPTPSLVDLIPWLTWRRAAALYIITLQLQIGLGAAGLATGNKWMVALSILSGVLSSSSATVRTSLYGPVNAPQSTAVVKRSRRKA